jgi:hypothetical protein
MLVGRVSIRVFRVILAPLLLGSLLFLWALFNDHLVLLVNDLKKGARCRDSPNLTRQAALNNFSSDSTLFFFQLLLRVFSDGYLMLLRYVCWLPAMFSRVDASYVFDFGQRKHFQLLPSYLHGLAVIHLLNILK